MENFVSHYHIVVIILVKVTLVLLLVIENSIRTLDGLMWHVTSTESDSQLIRHTGTGDTYSVLWSCTVQYTTVQQMCVTTDLNITVTGNCHWTLTPWIPGPDWDQVSALYHDNDRCPS